MVKVSVIVPVYNSEMFLRKCLESLIYQTLQDIEIICINDGSTDRSLAILHEYQSRDNRIKIINNEKNAGAAESRNKGLSATTGKYIQFVDADDFLENDALGNLYQAAEIQKADMCFLGMKLIATDAWKNMLQEGIKGYYPSVYNGKELIKLFTEKGEFFLYLCAVFYSRRFVMENNLKFRKLVIGEGGNFILRALCMAQKVIVRNEKYYHYRMNEISVTHSSNAKQELLFGQTVQYIDVLRYFSRQEDAVELGCFLLDLYKKIAGGIQGLTNKERIKFENRLETGFERYIFHLLEQNDKAYGIEFDEKMLLKMQDKKFVIVYGAGYATKEIIGLLQQHGIEIIGFAVTERREGQKAVYGHHVYEIKELLQYNKKAVVLIAANKRYNREIQNILEGYGFNDYIFLNVDI